VVYLNHVKSHVTFDATQTEYRLMSVLRNELVELLFFISRVFKILSENLTGRGPFGRCRYRYTWEDTVKMDFKQTAWEDVHWSLSTGFEQLPFVRTALNIRVASIAADILTKRVSTGCLRHWWQSRG
jgi:hypothetical protein